MLSELQVKNAKAQEKRYRISDTNGLSLVIYPTGKKSWNYRYRLPFGDRKQKTLALGEYPLISLKDARKKAMECHLLLMDGIDPGHEINKSQTGCSFEELARKWYERQSSEWSEGYAVDTLQRMEKNLFPFIGDMHVSQITPPKLLEALHIAEKRGVKETAQRMLQVAGRVFRYGIALGLCERDPSRDLEGVLVSSKTEHYATQTSEKAIGEILRKINATRQPRESLEVKLALSLAPYVFLRPSELAGIEKDEIQFERDLLVIRKERMGKTNKEHYVPLSKQAVSIIRLAYELSGNSPYIFPAPQNPKKPINDESLRMRLRRKGISKEEFTTHGFRHMASTLLNEKGYDHDAIELQLSHVGRDTVRATYNHAKKLDYRAKMMQEWADLIDEIRGEPLNLE